MDNRRYRAGIRQVFEMKLKRTNDNTFPLKGVTCFRRRETKTPGLIGIRSALLKCSIAVLFVWIIAGAVVPTEGNDFCKSKTTYTHSHDKFKRISTLVLNCKASTRIHSLSLPVSQKQPCCKKCSHRSRNVESLIESTSSFLSAETFIQKSAAFIPSKRTIRTNHNTRPPVRTVSIYLLVESFLC